MDWRASYCAVLFQLWQEAEGGMTESSLGDPGSVLCVCVGVWLLHSSSSLGFASSPLSLGFNTSICILLIPREEVEGYGALGTICYCFCPAGLWLQSTMSGIYVCAGNLNGSSCLPSMCFTHWAFSQPCLKQCPLTSFSLFPSGDWAVPYFSSRISKASRKKNESPHWVIFSDLDTYDTEVFKNNTNLVLELSWMFPRVGGEPSVHHYQYHYDIWAHRMCVAWKSMGCSVSHRSFNSYALLWLRIAPVGLDCFCLGTEKHFAPPSALGSKGHYKYLNCY